MKIIFDKMSWFEWVGIIYFIGLIHFACFNKLFDDQIFALILSGSISFAFLIIYLLVVNMRGREWNDFEKLYVDRDKYDELATENAREYNLLNDEKNHLSKRGFRLEAENETLEQRHQTLLKRHQFCLRQASKLLKISVEEFIVKIGEE